MMTKDRFSPDARARFMRPAEPGTLVSRYTVLSLTKEYRFDQSLEYMRQFGEHCRARDGRAAQEAIREALEWSLEYISETLIQSGHAVP